MLDAPALQNDFYLNLVDWSRQNVIAVGLGACVYLWNATNSKVTKLLDLAAEHQTVCSVEWTAKGTYLAVGTDAGDVQVTSEREREKRERKKEREREREPNPNPNPHHL